MFPDVRLMVVAVMASVVALVCGFGVFAAFRVNHEPLSRLSSVTAQSQLVADNAAPRAAGEPFGPRFQVSAAPIANPATGVPAPKPDRQDVAAPPSAVAPAAAEAEAPQQPPQPPAVVAPAAPTEPSATQDAATDATSEPPSPSSNQSPATTSSIAVVDPNQTPPADQAPAAAQAPVAPQAPAVAQAPEQTKPEAAPPPDQAPPVEQASQEAKPEAAPPADQAPPVAQASRAPEPESEAAAAAPAKAAPVAKSAQKTARKTVVRLRVAAAKVRRVRRPRATAIASSNTDNSSFQQPAFQAAQPAPPQFAARPLRPAVKRQRLARRAPVRPSAVGGPFVAPPAH